MKQLLRYPGRDRSGYLALAVFGLAYLATVALVVAPEQVVAFADTAMNWSAD